MLEEYDKIDTITKSDDGSVQLVVMDAGLTEDPDERYDHLIKKLGTYVAYSCSSEFRQEHPDITPDKISFLVMCRHPPTEKMENTKSISRSDNRHEGFAINYRYFPGTDEDVREVQPRDTTPLFLVHKHSNIPVHITFGFLFLYIVATRYLLYFGPAQGLHSFSPAQAIGATLGYLFVWSFGYWLCTTTPKKALVTWIGGSAVFLSTLIGSFVGYVLLVVIFFIRKSQRNKC